MEEAGGEHRQATARDCLTEALLAPRYRIKIAFHVHDEVVLDVPIRQGSLDVLTPSSEPLPWRRAFRSADGF